MYKESKVQNDVTSDHILVLSEQDGDIVGNMSFRDKKKDYLKPCNNVSSHFPLTYYIYNVSAR